MISYISENSRVTLQLVGGLKEESGKGGVLSKRILSYFATHRCNFIPTLVCLGPINTKIRNRAEPIVGKILILHYVGISSSGIVVLNENLKFAGKCFWKMYPY